jgi:putative ABC transport system permease protein
VTPGQENSPLAHHIEAFLQDLRQGIRGLSKAPTFSVTVVAALALGIGASAAIFSVVNAVLLRPLPYPASDRIILFGIASPTGPTVWSASPIEFNVWRAQSTTFEDIAAYRFGRISLTGVDHPEQIRSALVTSAYFRLFGAKVAFGRTFTADEDRPEGGNVVVLSAEFSRRAFGSDSQMMGKEIFLGGKPHTVVGITTRSLELPAAFNPAEAREPIDVWIPFQIDHRSTDTNQYFTVAARLKPGISLGAVRAQLRLVTPQFRRRFPTAGIAPEADFTALGLREALVGGDSSLLPVFSGAVACLLLIACANVANLCLVRGTARKHEIAIRAAVGAGRGRIARQLLAESVLLSVAGGALGLALGTIGIRVLLALNTVGIPRIGDHGSAVTADWRVLTFTALVSLVTCILFGLFPALQASRADLSEGLQESRGRCGTARRQTKARSLLVSSELALALVLVVGAGLLIRSFIALRSVNPGLESRNVLTLRVSLAATPRFQKSSAVAELVRESVQRIGAIPGVIAASSTCCLPFEDNLIGGVIIRGRPLRGRDHGSVDVATVSPRYFDVLRIPMVRGRAFTDRDARGATPVVIINQTMARRYWPGEDTSAAPLQANLEFPDVPTYVWQIIGIAGDVHTYGLSQSPPATVYFPVAQAPEDFNAYIVRSPVAWIVRTLGDPGPLRRVVQQELIRATGGTPVSSVRSMDEILSQSTAGREFNMLLLTIFGSSALLLAAIGIYGLMAYSVQQRTPEIGVRLALGAKVGDVQNLVIFQGMRVALLGVVVGCTAAFCLTHLIASLLFGVKSHDPMVFLLAPALLSVVAFFAVWLPARRASRIDPVDALRHD